VRRVSTPSFARSGRRKRLPLQGTRRSLMPLHGWN